MIHYWAELAVWTGMMFLAGCPLGALARRTADRRRGGRGGISGAA